MRGYFNCKLCGFDQPTQFSLFRRTLDIRHKGICLFCKEKILNTLKSYRLSKTEMKQ